MASDDRDIALEHWNQDRDMYDFVRRKNKRILEFAEQCPDFAKFLEKVTAKFTNMAKRAGLRPKDFKIGVAQIVNGGKTMVVNLPNRRN